MGHESNSSVGAEEAGVSDESDRLRNARIKQEIEAARRTREQRARRSAPRAGPTEAEEQAAFDEWFKNSKYGRAEKPFVAPKQESAAPSTDTQLLGLPAVFTSAQLKKAYRAKAFLTHPDRGGSASSFTAVQNAYERLVPYARTDEKP